MPRWISRPSVSCRPIVSTGFSDVIGSWKIMPISRPRTLRISYSDRSRRLRPLNMIRPDTMRPAGSETSRMIDSAVTLLPQPDSPTSATVSPSCTSQLTPSTARTSPLDVENCVARFSTDSSAGIGARVYHARIGPGTPRRRRGIASAAVSRGQVVARPRLQTRILPADRVRDAGPAVIRRPAHALLPEIGPQLRILEQHGDALGQSRDVAF